ncbi:MAG TPA: hypothetical protein VMK83_06780 [Gaiellaceae bacterium]|nr:hypothetical protein [Gaiellaceae bacterium]
MFARGIVWRIEGDVTDARGNIAGRYFGADDGRCFAAARTSKPGVLLRLPAADPPVWDLKAILPPSS